MLLVHEDTNKRVIKASERINFSSFSSLHLIVITARVKGKKQISNRATDDEDLTVKIDNKSFPKLSYPERTADSAAAFSGGSLHDLAKTVYFLIFLKGKDHKIELTTDKLPNTATLEDLKVYTLYSEQELILEPGQQAEDGDRRPWITIVLEDLSLKAITPTITYSRRKRDSDDIKIIIDNKVQDNLLKTIKHFLWRYAGSLLLPLATKTETETFIVNLPLGLHYLEFWADRTPILNSLTLDFGNVPSIPLRIPTINNPAWTNDFYDDTEEMLLARTIYGEMGSESYEAKIAVGWTIRNRVEDNRDRWGKTYHEVILQAHQFDALWNKHTYNKVREPPISENKREKEVWEDSYRAAIQIVSGKTPDPTKGANHFYSTTISEPSWADEKKLTTQVGITKFYKL